MTWADCWKLYAPVSERDNDSWKSDAGRAAIIMAHDIGRKPVGLLCGLDVDEYRRERMLEKTIRGKSPAWGTLDREVELMKRVLNYAVHQAKKLHANPLEGVKLLNKPNVRRSVVDEPTFQALHDASPESIRALLVSLFDTGMRVGELLGVEWPQVDLVEGCIELYAEDTKGEQARKVYLTRRVVEALASLKANAAPDQRRVFSFVDFRKSFKRAAAAIGRPELWVHDIRRSFVTRARRKGIAEKVVMRMSGHKTRAVFDRYNIVFDSDVQDAARRLE